jgi:phage baseplate assembly protein W
MAGMSRTTAKDLEGFDHLKQSIEDILTTPVGSRVHRRDYGSNLPRLVDRPINSSLVSDLVAATAEALDRWEPRLRLERVQIDSVTPASNAEKGQIELSLVGYYLLDGRRIEIEGLVI